MSFKTQGTKQTKALQLGLCEAQPTQTSYTYFDGEIYEPEMLI